MSIGDVIRAGIKAGKSTEDILADVRKQFPQANTKAASVAWYRSQMKKGGGDATPKTKKTAVAKAAQGEPSSHFVDTVKANREKAGMPAMDFVPGKGFVPKAEAPKGYSVGSMKKTHGIEGEGYIVKLLRDGKPVAEAADYGDGGMTHFDWFDKGDLVDVVGLTYDDGAPMHEKENVYKGTREEATFWLYCRQQPRYSSSWDEPGVTHAVTPEIMVEELVNEAELTKQLRRMTKDKIVMIEGGKLYTLKPPKGVTEMALANVRATNPAATILNGMDEREAVKLLASLQ